MNVTLRHSRAPALAGALGAGYFALACGGLQLVDLDDGAAVIWPSAGLALGALVVAPRRMWPAFAVAILLANFAAQLFVRGSTVELSSAIAVNGLVQSLLAAYVMTAIAGGQQPRIGSARTVAGLFGASVIAGALAGLGGAASLALATDQGLGTAFMGWWLGNAIGMIVVTPVVVAIARPDEVGSSRLEAVALIAMTSAVAAVLFCRNPGSGMAILSFAYLIVPFILWCAIRAGARATTFASLIVATIATIATVDGLGPFTARDLTAHEQGQALQSFLATILLTTLVVGAVVADQRRARAEARTEADRLATALAALHRAQADLRTVFEQAPIGHVILDGNGELEDSNAAARAISGYDTCELRAAPGELLIHPDSLGPLRDLLAAIRSGETAAGELEVQSIHRDGHLIDVAVFLAALGHEDDAAGRTLMQVVDVSERKRLEARLRELADHDPLTGLLNRRAFDRELEGHVARADRYGADGAVIVLDLDQFKRVNDSEGHHVGDDLLAAVARLLKRRLRATDVVARLGGDEFAILLPSGDRDDAALIAQSLVTGVRDELDVTISLGVAMIGDDGADSASQLLIAADRAMYAAKASGRDRHAFFALGS